MGRCRIQLEFSQYNNNPEPRNHHGRCPWLLEWPSLSVTVQHVSLQRGTVPVATSALRPLGEPHLVVLLRRSEYVVCFVVPAWGIERAPRAQGIRQRPSSNSTVSIS